MRRDFSIGLLTAFFVGFVLLAPILSNRLIDIFGIKVAFGTLMIPLACSLLDVINNNFGARVAKDVVITSVVVRFTIYGLVALGLLIPVVKETPGFSEMILTGIRLLIASELAIGLSQYFIDIPLFSYMKERYGHFFVRYNVSNLVSTAIQGTIFVLIGFWGSRLHTHMWDMIWGGYILKIGLQFVLSPVLLVLVNLMKPQPAEYVSDTR